ncbi:MAG TPA: hypothetical protein DDW42_10160 [Desulfobacteraceae bacterium]|nr:hypothetical protein [Desulfobacteraceae bacterium]
MLKKILSNFCLLAVSSFFVLLIPLTSSLAAEFSADLVQKMPQGTYKGKIFVKDKKFRQETNMMNRKQVMIFRRDTGVALILMPENHMYMEMSGLVGAKDAPQIDQQKLEEMAEKKYQGKEKMNGYMCEKYLFIYHDKSMGTMTQWFSKKLNFPIKMEMKRPSGNIIIEYKNIREKDMQDSLFEIPAGYQKMSIPGIMKGMGS